MYSFQPMSRRFPAASHEDFITYTTLPTRRVRTEPTDTRLRVMLCSMMLEEATTMGPSFD